MVPCGWIPPPGLWCTGMSASSGILLHERWFIAWMAAVCMMGLLPALQMLRQLAPFKCIANLGDGDVLGGWLCYCSANQTKLQWCEELAIDVVVSPTLGTKLFTSHMELGGTPQGVKREKYQTHSDLCKVSSLLMAFMLSMDGLLAAHHMSRSSWWSLRPAAIFPKRYDLYICVCTKIQEAREDKENKTGWAFRYFLSFYWQLFFDPAATSMYQGLVAVREWRGGPFTTWVPKLREKWQRICGRRTRSKSHLVSSAT